jgi:hypothetical protein
MTLEVILCQCLGEIISNLILSAYGKNLDESLSHMFTNKKLSGNRDLE